MMSAAVSQTLDGFGLKTASVSYVSRFMTAGLPANVRQNHSSPSTSKTGAARWRDQCLYAFAATMCSFVGFGGVGPRNGAMIALCVEPMMTEPSSRSRNRRPSGAALNAVTCLLYTSDAADE